MKKLKRLFWQTVFFFEEIGRQNDLLYTGIGAPYEKVHWCKTRNGFKFSWMLAGLRCDIRNP